MNVVYPEPINGTDALWWKAVIIVTLVCVIALVLRMGLERHTFRNEQPKWTFDGLDAFAGVIFGVLAGPCIVGVVWCLWFVFRG